MDYLIHKLLDSEKITTLNEKLKEENCDWENGKKTAGQHAAQAKNNLQLNRDSSLSITISQELRSTLISDPLIKSYSIPRKIHGLMITKTLSGQGYGMHVDNPYMSSGRSDLSFTLFLNDPKSYEGGELCIQTIQENKEIKLEPGNIIIYPSTTLHSVKRVSSGERLVCVGWIHSYISSNEDRNLLFSLEAGAKSLLANQGRSDALDLVFQSYSNLIRRLGD